MIENVDIEFKEVDRKTGKLPDSISREIIAFANAEGGTLYIGIGDDGRAVGVENPDDVMTRLTNVARETILPDIRPFIDVRAVEMDGKYVIKTTVFVGTERPYYLAKEGLTPKGVFIRKGAACVPLSEAGIREMIMETSGKSFEESRSLNQDLTFQTLNAELRARGMEFGAEQMKTLKLVGRDGLYNNLALLLSDQCVHTVKVAVFQGADNAVFRDRREFSGSLLKQLEDIYAFLDRYNRTEASFSGLRRMDRRDYPPEAIREALLNSMVHRDYLFSGSTIINLYEDHLEFVSLGGLVPGLSMEAVFLGASQSRNPNLAAVFYRLGLVESYGTGVRKILRLYQDAASLPVFHSAEGAFTVVMKNRNAGSSDSTVSSVRSEEQIQLQSGGAEYVVKALALEKGQLTRKDVEEALQVGSTKAYKVLKQLCAEGVLVQILQGNRTVYVPAERR